MIKSPYSQQYINYCCKNHLHYFCFLCLSNSAISFLQKGIGHKPVFIPLSNKGQQHACVSMYTHGHQTMVIETSKTTKFWACLFYNMFYIG